MNKQRGERKLYLSAQRNKIILVFCVLHEFPVIVDKKYQCKGVFINLYGCLGAKKHWKEQLFAGPGPLVARQVLLTLVPL